jgi:thiol-disulfide isomerase/thioredoxin
MDRLPTLIASVSAIAALVACDAGSSSSGDPSSRVNAVKGKAPRVSAAELCDVRFDAEKAPAFAMPALAGTAPAANAHWRWVNVWATWCKPCVEEIPRLQRWAASHAGTLDLVLVSADSSDAEITTFRSAHPGVPATARIADPDALPSWLTTVGLDAGATIPIHVLVDPSGRTRCVRAGGVGDDDLVAADALLDPAANAH